jgi:hypothetical protein
MPKRRSTTDDRLEPTRDREAVPEPIVAETTYASPVPPEAQEADVHPDGDDVERADTDRDIAGAQRAGELLPTREVPTSIVFQLRPIRSTSAKCFFCGELDCDQVFVSKVKPAHKIEAYAVHDQCVFDHVELQALASGGT